MSYTNLGRQIFPLFLLCILVSFSTLSLSSPLISYFFLPPSPRHFSVLSLTLVEIQDDITMLVGLGERGQIVLQYHTLIEC